MRDYRRKGDRFSRGLSPMPRVYTRVENRWTGRTYYKRRRTNTLPRVKVADVLGVMGRDKRDEIAERGVYLSTPAAKVLVVSDNPPGQHVSFETTQQHIGWRLWFVCPECSRRAGVIYVATGTWGCCKCLGLTYPSQAGHKTPAHDADLIYDRVRGSFRAKAEATERFVRRINKLGASLDRLKVRHRH